jgi:hypothetical protein
MAKVNRPRLSLKGDLNVPTTEPIARPAAEPNARSQEKSMEAATEKTAEAPVEQTGLTAKQMAAAEEQNQMRMRALADQQNAPPPPEPVNVIEVAAMGYDALHEAFRKHALDNPVKEYIPPPRTPRQMTALQEELEAGRRAQQRAEAQQAAAKPAPVDLNKEGFTTPAYRPNDMVPDPVTGKLGQSAS